MVFIIFVQADGCVYEPLRCQSSLLSGYHKANRRTNLRKLQPAMAYTHSRLPGNYLKSISLSGTDPKQLLSRNLHKRLLVQAIHHKMC
jgi:hypothetical protein